MADPVATIANPGAAPAGTIAAPAGATGSNAPPAAGGVAGATGPAAAPGATGPSGATAGSPGATGGTGGTGGATGAPGATGPGPAGTDGAWPTDGLPPDYRARMLKGLEGDDLRAATNILERLGSPADIVKKLLSQERTLSQPRKAAKPGKDAKPEELAAWRKENGVPDAPDKYEIKLPDGKVLGDADKAVLKDFAPALHEAGLSNEQMSTVVDRYLSIVEAETNKMVETDATNRATNEAALRAEWGSDFQRNLNAISVIMQDAPKGMSDQLLNGRLADGRKIGDTPEVLKFLSGLALQAVPAATLLPNDMPNGATLVSEIAAIEQKMKTDIAGYFKDPVMQKRYADLLQAREITESKVRKA